MIKAKDLRIGNLAQQINRNDNNYTVKEITPMDIVGQHQCDVSGYELFVGIPINEEWLLRAWFEKRRSDNGLHIWDNGRIELNHNFEVSLFDGRPDGNETKSFDIIVKYVHQLQNLFAALTGEELEIKEK